MNHLEIIDYAIIVVYLLALSALGFYLKNKASESIEDYIVGARKIPWWAMGFSGMANFLDLTSTALIISFLFILGPQGLFVEFRGGVGLILIFMMLWTGKWHRRSGCLTGAEWNIFRFGDGIGGRGAQIIQVVGTLVGSFGMVAMMIVGVGSFLSVFLPFTPTECAIGLAVVATIYTMISGFYGVVITDIIQSIIIVIAVFYISYIAFNMISDSNQIQMLAYEITQNKDWVNAFPKWNVDLPRSYEAYNHLILFAFFYLLRNIFGGMGAGAVPIYFGARNDRDCGLLSFMWAIMMTFRWPLMIGIAVMGLFLVQGLFPDMSVISRVSELIHQQLPAVTQAQWNSELARIINNPELFEPHFLSSLKSLLGNGEDWQSKLQLVGFYGDINAEKILPLVIGLTIPAGMKGVILVALIAASMSTFDSNINTATGMVVRDIYQKYFRPQASTQELIYCSWVTVVVIVLIAFLFAATISSINDIWGWIVMGLGGGVLMPTLLRFYWWRFNGIGYLVGTLFGMVGAVSQRIIIPELSEIWMFVIIVIIGFIGCLIGTYASAPTESKVLEKFYRQTRPFGLWGPVKHILSSAVRQRMEKEHKNDLLSVPFMFVFQVSLYLTSMFLIVHSFDFVYIGVAVIAVSLVGLYYFWYRHLPETNFEPELEFDANQLGEAENKATVSSEPKDNLDTVSSEPQNPLNVNA